MSDRATLQRLWVLMLTVFVDMLGFLLVLPLLPFYAKNLGANAFTVGALVSAFSFAQLVTSPLWGRLSDRYGRRPVLLIALFASVVAYAIFGLAHSLWLLFVMRFVQGAGGGTTGVAQAYVSDSVPPEDRSKALGWLSAATNAGVMIGPAIALLSARLGPEAPGFVAASLCLLNVVSAWIWLPESRVPQAAVEKRPRVRDAVVRVLRHPLQPVSALIWIYALAMMAFFAMNGVLALFLGRKFGVDEHTIGWFYVYVGAISLVMRTLVLGPAVRLFGDRGAMRLGFLALAVGLFTIPLGSKILGFAAAALLVPVGTALLFPPTSSLVSRFARKDEVGQTLGVQQAFGGVARMLGPLWAGFCFDRYGIGTPFWIASALIAATSFLLRPLAQAQPDRPRDSTASAPAQ